MEWIKDTINGVITKKLTKHMDDKGYFMETFRLDELAEGLNPVMSYLAYLEPGCTRIPHEHQEKTDVLAFPGPGNFLIRIWDKRQGSSTYGHLMEFYAGQDNPMSVVIPPGLIHGYKNVSRMERGLVINYPDRLYKGWDKKGEVDEIIHESAGDLNCTMD
ncbi:MAG: dTDP-4-dehydrorhamnose 3,5-epimerase family protein [Dehalobacterium sp.]|jgi:dTDP-4-dehydrorhamnose 3,5-epimerase